MVSLACIVGCAALALFSAGRPAAKSAMDSAFRLLSWIEIPASTAKREIDLFFRWTAERRSLLAELAELREENRELRLLAGEKASEELKKHVRAGNRYAVVFRDPADWWDAVKINVGADAYEPGTAVLDGSDLVGVVDSCEKGSAWVRLMSSEDFFVPVVVEETREIGVVTGDSEGGVWLKYLPADGRYAPGMKVFTVLGARLPPGLPVGELTDERRSISPGIDEYRIKTSADLFRLQYVNVVEVKEP
ncbi:MAG: rod shape-determining protein MreC [Pyramidobacter sp.]|jgi:rod shape-determining protein MreC